jgi:hypothetical protein
MNLDEAMSIHGIVSRVDIREEPWRGKLARMVQGVVDNVIFIQEFILQISVKIIECSSRISKCRISTIPWGWQLVRKQKRITSSTGIEARVNMKQVVTLDINR